MMQEALKLLMNKSLGSNSPGLTLSEEILRNLLKQIHYIFIAHIKLNTVLPTLVSPFAF